MKFEGNCTWWCLSAKCDEIFSEKERLDAGQAKVCELRALIEERMNSLFESFSTVDKGAVRSIVPEASSAHNSSSVPSLIDSRLGGTCEGALSPPWLMHVYLRP